MGDKAQNAADSVKNAANDAKNAVKDALPTRAEMYNYGDLQKNVGFFGIGNKVDQAASKVKSAASDVADKAGTSNINDAAQKVGDVANKAGASNITDAAQKVGQKVDENTPDSFSIFNTSGLKDAASQLSAKVEDAKNAIGDPAENVFPVQGKKGETQEENAEFVRRQAEGNTAMGDARAPTN